MKSIMVATDGSPSAASAVAFGVELAVEGGGTVHFVYVVPSVPARAFPMVSVPHELAPPDDAPAPLVVALRYASAHAVQAEGKALSGDPVDEIVAHADSLDADLIVLGSRRARRVRKCAARKHVPWRHRARPAGQCWSCMATLSRPCGPPPRSCRPYVVPREPSADRAHERHELVPMLAGLERPRLHASVNAAAHREVER